MLHSVGSTLPHLVTARVEALAALKPGWLAGQGVGIQARHLEQLRHGLAALPEGMPLPTLAPTEDGHVILEWIRPRVRVELEVNFSDQRLELYAADFDTNVFVEDSFECAAWAAALARVATLLR